MRHGQNPWENRGKSMVNMDFNGIMILGNAVETPSFLAKVTGEISIAIFDYQNIIPETRMGILRLMRVDGRKTAHKERKDTT